MTEPKKTEFHVVDADGQTLYTSDNLDKAQGVAEYLAAENEEKYKITQTILV